MNSLVQRILFSRHNLSVLNSCSKCVREVHLLRNQCISLTMARSAPRCAIKIVCQALNSNLYTPNRQKYDRKNPKSYEDSDAEEDDDADLEEFREGKTDRVTQVKTQTLRLDAVIKAGLGISKKSIEKLFYDSKLRVNGKKITKKSMDITSSCEIDVIKGPSPDNSNFLIVGRIEVLAVKAEGMVFVITIRRNKSLTIENYDSGAKYSE